MKFNTNMKMKITKSFPTKLNFAISKSLFMLEV